LGRDLMFVSWSMAPERLSNQPFIYRSSAAIIRRSERASPELHRLRRLFSFTNVFPRKFCHKTVNLGVSPLGPEGVQRLVPSWSHRMPLGSNDRREHARGEALLAGSFLPLFEEANAHALPAIFFLQHRFAEVEITGRIQAALDEWLAKLVEVIRQRRGSRSANEL